MSVCVSCLWVFSLIDVVFLKCYHEHEKWNWPLGLQSSTYSVMCFPTTGGSSIRTPQQSGKAVTILPGKISRQAKANWSYTRSPTVRRYYRLPCRTGTQSWKLTKVWRLAMLISEMTPVACWVSYQRYLTGRCSTLTVLALLKQYRSSRRRNYQE